MKKKIHFVMSIIYTIIFAIILTACRPINAGEDYSDCIDVIILPGQEEELETDVDSSEEGSCKVHFIDVGQGDATLIVCEGEAMLIDGGNSDCGTVIQAYLSNLGLHSLKYVVATHYDEDHIGGLPTIIYKYDCDTLLMPEESKDTWAYEKLMDCIEEKGYKIVTPCVGDVFQLGDATVDILSPIKAYEEYNDTSLVLRLTHGENIFLFTGDASSLAEVDYMQNITSADVLKVSHHGSNTGTSEELLEKITPEYAVISCGSDNEYGHPHATVLNRLKEKNISLFRTDEQGSVVCISNGKEITWNVLPSVTWKPGVYKEPEESIEEEAEMIPENTRYVCNTSSMKFHLPGCDSVADMNPKNRLYTEEEREKLIEEGYEPCKVCNP